MKMTDRERAIQAIRRGVQLGQVVACSCHRSPPVRNGCFGVCEDAVEAIIASYEAVRAESLEQLEIATAELSAYALQNTNLRNDLVQRGMAQDAALDQLGKQSWQPIETAPKDGTNILICGTGDDGYYVADVKWDADEGEFCLFHPDDDMHSAPTYLPKFWMPLPASPFAVSDDVSKGN